MANANKFDFIETLKAHGFSYSTGPAGNPIFTLSMSQQAEDALFGTFKKTFKVCVVFDTETVCHVYYNDYSPIWNWACLPCEQTWNEICVKAEKSGFEMPEVV